jgi:hypothetical protein
MHPRQSEDQKTLDYSIIPIPQKIHFIWVGAPIKEYYLVNILKIARLAYKSQFEVNIWVNDEKNITKLLQKFASGIIENPTPKKIAGIHIRNINELYPRMEKDPFLQNKSVEIITSINKEMIGFSNFAAASDILRHIILWLEGGYYLDTDNQLTFNKSDRLEKESTILGLKTPQYRDDDNGEFVGGSHFIASISQHPAIQHALEYILQSLHDLNNKTLGAWTCKRLELKKNIGLTKNDSRRWPYSSRGNYRENVMGKAYLTIASIGPGALSYGIKRFWDEQTKLEKDEEKLWKMQMSLRKEEISNISSHTTFHKTWLKVPKKVRYFDDTELNTRPLFARTK